MARERVARVELAPKERARSVFFSSLLQSDADEKYPFVGLIEFWWSPHHNLARLSMIKQLWRMCHCNVT